MDNAEDEIAAITMAIGGALTGTRSATATSGPGFSLMAEALGWAGMNEVPIVVSLYQRAGPATGLPTRHEQGDLPLAIRAGHGEFPRVVFESGDIEESYYDSIKVFNFTEKFQLPAIHMLDKAIANSITTCRIFDQNKVHIDRGSYLENIFLESLDSARTEHYQRFRLTKDNNYYTIDSISPRVPLGTENGIFWNTGGHITEDPNKAILYGTEDPNALTVISWGSTKGAILGAMDKLIEEGKMVRFIQLRLLHPFPSERVKALIDGFKPLVDIEMNYSSQLASLINENLRVRMDYLIAKYNGRPMSSSEIYGALVRIISGNAPKRIILERGG